MGPNVIARLFCWTSIVQLTSRLGVLVSPNCYHRSLAKAFLGHYIPLFVSRNIHCCKTYDDNNCKFSIKKSKYITTRKAVGFSRYLGMNDLSD